MHLAYTVTHACTGRLLLLLLMLLLSLLTFFIVHVGAGKPIETANHFFSFLFFTLLLNNVAASDVIIRTTNVMLVMF